MPNKAYAEEWLSLAKRNLNTAKLLFKENHYTDIIAIEIQQTIEKSFKAIYAFYGAEIPRTHVLQALFNFVMSKIQLSVEIDDIIIISDYYETDRYPGPKYFIPETDEIAKNLLLAENLFNDISEHITDLKELPS